MLDACAFAYASSYCLRPCLVPVPIPIPVTGAFHVPMTMPVPPSLMPRIEPAHILVPLLFPLPCVYLLLNACAIAYAYSSPASCLFLYLFP